MGHRSEPTIIILLIGQSTKMLTKSVSLPLDYVQLSDLIREVSFFQWMVAHVEIHN